MDRPDILPYAVRPSCTERLSERMRAIGVSDDGIDIMLPKESSFVISLPKMKAPKALILKQQMLSLGGDAAYSRKVLTDSSAVSEVILFGTEVHYRRLAESIKRQQFGMNGLSKQIDSLLRGISSQPKILRARDKSLDLSERTAIMGVLNITPDSFSDGGDFLEPSAAIDRALQMAIEGADIIDIGAESTRPGAKSVDSAEQIRRLLPVLSAIKGRSNALISVDTCRADVAGSVLQEGADIINDISGLNFDRGMADVVASHDAGIVIMHIKGTPQNMQDAPHYDDLLGEVYSSLAQSCSKALEAGIDRTSIVVDPGIGFGKTLKHNLELLNNLFTFKGLSMPILIGPSRKSFLGRILNAEVGERLFGTAASVAVGILRGATIVRVHDVSEIRQVRDVADAILRS
ncbi:dihydropteroate synthase [bacterium]|nr:dihydropteroate synthase [bacterium]